MTKYTYSVLSILLGVSLWAQQPVATKKVWTNDDFPSGRAITQPETTKTPPALLPTPKTAGAIEDRLELRNKGLSLLRKALDQTTNELEQAATPQERHALVAKIKVIERDIEDEREMIHDLQTQLAALKAKSATATATASGNSGPHTAP